METQINEQKRKEYIDMWASIIEQSPAMTDEPKLPVKKETLDRRIARIRTSRLEKQLSNLEEQIKRITPQIEQTRNYLNQIKNSNCQRPVIRVIGRQENEQGYYFFEEDYSLLVNTLKDGRHFLAAVYANYERNQKKTFEENLKKKIICLKDKARARLLRGHLISARDYYKKATELRVLLNEHQKTPHSLEISDKVIIGSLEKENSKRNNNLRLNNEKYENSALGEKFENYLRKKIDEMKKLIDKKQNIRYNLDHDCSLPTRLTNINPLSENNRETILDYVRNLGDSLVEFTTNLTKLKIRKEIFGKDASFEAQSYGYYDQNANDSLTGADSLDEEIAEEEKQIPLIRADFYEMRNTPYLDKPETWQKIKPYEAKTLTAKQWEDYKQKHLNPKV